MGPVSVLLLYNKYNIVPFSIYSKMTVSHAQIESSLYNAFIYMGHHLHTKLVLQIGKREVDTRITKYNY